MVREKESIIMSLCALCLACCCMAYGGSRNEEEFSFLIPDGSECIEIVNADSLHWDTSYFIRELFDAHPALIVADYVTVLDDMQSSPIPLSFGLPIADIHWEEGQCFFASGSTIYYGEDNGKVNPIIESDKIIQSFSVSDKRILFPSDTFLLEYTFGASSANCLINAYATISHIEDLSSSIFYSSGKDVVLIHEGNAYRIYSSQDEITSFAVHSNGCLFIGTSSGLRCVSPKYDVIDIASIPIRDISLIGDDLYVVLNNKGSVRITNVSNYQRLLNANLKK